MSEAAQNLRDEVPQKAGPGRGPGLTIVVAVVALLLAVAWRWGPLREMVDVGVMVEMVQSVPIWPDAILMLLGAYVIGGLVMLPVTLVIVVTSMILAPLAAFALAVSGSLASALVTFGIGRWVGRDVVRQWTGPKLSRLNQAIASHGLLSVIFVRVVPVAPFSVVNLVAGASELRLDHFLVGTVLGMSPGITLVVLFIDRLTAAVVSPGVSTFALLGATILLGWGGVTYLARRLRERDGRRNAESASERSVSPS